MSYFPVGVVVQVDTFPYSFENSIMFCGLFREFHTEEVVVKQDWFKRCFRGNIEREDIQGRFPTPESSQLQSGAWGESCSTLVAFLFCSLISQSIMAAENEVPVSEVVLMISSICIPGCPTNIWFGTS